VYNLRSALGRPHKGKSGVIPILAIILWRTLAGNSSPLAMPSMSSDWIDDYLIDIPDKLQPAEVSIGTSVDAIENATVRSGENRRRGAEENNQVVGVSPTQPIANFNPTGAAIV
jgi:hypothetical protein